MKLLIFTSALFSATFAQRGFYAGTLPKGYPELHSRFQDTNVNGSITTDVQLEDRLAESDPAANRNVPTDARGDVNLVNRLSQWSRDQQPFWLINADHIERHRHPDQAVNANANEQTLEATINNQNTQFRSKFEGNNQNSRSKLASDKSDQNIQFTQSRFGGNVSDNVNDQRSKSYYAGQRSGNVR